MHSLLPGILWLHWRSIAYTHTCTAVSLLSFLVVFCTFPPDPTPPSFPPSLLSSPPLASLLAHLATLKVGDGSKSSKIFFLLFFVDSQRGSETGAPRLITAVNQKPALTSLPWSEKSVTAALWKVQRPVWRYIVLSTLEQAKKKGAGRGGVKFTPCQLHFLKLSVTYL